MRRTLIVASAALLSCLPLTACGSLPQPQPVVSSTTLPPEAFMCTGAPTVPEGVTLTDQGVALYIMSLYAAWYDCATQLNLVGKAK